jgi:hypothetical protein
MSIITTWVDNGSPFVVPSAMSKAGIEVMTKSLAVEWAPYGVRLNAVGPGEIPTEGMSKRLNPGEEPGARSRERNPMARPGKMSELQNLAAFLMASGQCDWLTGQAIMMDGGNALATGGNFYEDCATGTRRTRRSAEVSSRRRLPFHPRQLRTGRRRARFPPARIEAQNAKDRVEAGVDCPAARAQR